MISYNKAFFFCILYLLCSFTICFGQSADSLTIDCQNEMIMDFEKAVIFAPHFDDEVLGFSGVIYDAVQKKKDIKIVVASDGAAYVFACHLWKNGCPPDSCAGTPCDKTDFDQFAQKRISETRAALSLYGVDSSQLILLGYPDGGFRAMYDSLEKEIPANGTLNRSFTGKAISGKNLIEDIKNILRDNGGATLFTTHEADHHGDHSRLASFVQMARKDLKVENLTYKTYWTLIHQPSTGNGKTWPLPASDWTQDNYQDNRMKRYNPQAVLTAPEHFEEGAIRFCIDPLLWEQTGDKLPLMRLAIDSYQSQLGSVLKNGQPMVAKYYNRADYKGYLISFVKRNHLYWQAPAPK